MSPGDPGPPVATVGLSPDARPAPGPDRDAGSGAARWRRLDIRVVWVDLVVFVISLVPSALAALVRDVGSTRFGIWPATIATSIGVISSVSDLWRWLKTRYRVTDERVEMRTGKFVRTYRWVPRERVRSVDTSARLRHRLARLRVVHIGTGEGRTLTLDAVSPEAAEQLRRELMRAVPAGRSGPVGDAATSLIAAPAGPPGATPTSPVAATPAGRSGPTGDASTSLIAAAPEPADPEPPATGPREPASAPVVVDGEETVIARLRWHWIFYNMINIWAFLVAALMLVSVYWFFLAFGVDLLEVVGDLIDWEALGPAWSTVVVVGSLYAIGVAGHAVNFAKGYWRFELVRTSTERGPVLLTRRGLFKINHVHRDERRVRGFNTSEPLCWRWMGLTEVELLSTGLAGLSSGGEPASNIVPRVPIGEARRVAAHVFDDGIRPLEAPLRAHPRRGLYRRLYWATAAPAVAAGLLAWLGATGAVAGWAWLVPVALLPVAWLLAVVAHRALGHTVVGPYLVFRSGVSRRSTTVLLRRAVLGWTLRQSFLQRWLGLVTVGVATSAGERYYQAPDIDARAVVGLIAEATPWLVATVAEPRG